MKSLYRDYLDGWRARGGHLFMHFDSVSFAGPFGRQVPIHAGQLAMPACRARTGLTLAAIRESFGGVVVAPDASRR